MAKTGYKRATRVADQIRMEVADIIMRRTKDPRLGAVTVTDVDLTSDLRLAHVYFTTFTPENDTQSAEVQSGLSRASGFIRSELGRRLHLRYTPELVFHRDVSGPRGDRLLMILEGLESGEGERGAETRPPDSPRGEAREGGDR